MDYVDLCLYTCRYGRVNFVLAQRLELLEEVGRLQNSLNVPGDMSYTCETAGYFYLYQVSFSTMLFIFLLPISLIFLANAFSKILLLTLVILFFILILVNFRFLKYSLKCGGIKMFTTHLFLRIFEMLTAITGISISMFQLLLKRLRGI